MTDWLLDTLVWTAVLIALVLLIRRPVARWFGPQAAYALWALPLLRLVLPPITLPAWMAPADPAAAAPEGETAYYVLVNPEAVATSAPAPALFPFTIFEIVVAAWLTGAAAFLFLRFRAYRRMRQDMLADSRDVGRAGKVRLVETPSTSAPLAFGVIDKVVALPVGFLATWDREARDLALAHELAHHRGQDLLINMAVQPLFALHWFNPLGHLGWLALRRDQEAACDARVIAEAEPAMLATYARVIASFAAGPNVALAAPMACPVLGDKSIIHRLRSLKMNNHSQRRRLAGGGLLTAALVALPLTATISYAESVQTAPEPPEAPVAPEAPVPPAAPEAPEAPPAPNTVLSWETEIDVLADAPKAGEKRTVVIRKLHEGKDGDGETHKTHEVRRIVIRDGDGKLSPEERAEMEREIREAMKEMRTDMAQARHEVRLAFKDMEAAKGEMTSIDFNCDGDLETSAKVDGKGTRKVVVCKSQIMASALQGLKAARDAIAKDGAMSEEIRAEVLRSLDEEIKNWKEEAK